tara:strand:- start:155 stop:808 length:654 start_codon:yes stop_codon:yes gene_type:complete
MNVFDAVLSRKSIRSFLSDPVDSKIIKDLLSKASRSPSGGNLQPWKIYVLNKQSMDEFLKFQSKWIDEEFFEYDIYPKKLKEPYRTYRYSLGEQMYSLLGIPREDKEARIKQVLKNYEFFGAPAALFCYVDRDMGKPQWSDLGMFLQTFMLLAREVGLDTCAQEAWAMKSKSVSKFLESPNNYMLFCGMAIGYRDDGAKINSLKSERASLDDWATFV